MPLNISNQTSQSLPYMNLLAVPKPLTTDSYLRSKAIFVLTNECVKEFIDHEKELLDGTYPGPLGRVLINENALLTGRASIFDACRNGRGG
jgi:hypothetical protein